MSQIILSDNEIRTYLPSYERVTNDGDMIIRMDKSRLFTVFSNHYDTLTVFIRAYIFCNLTGRIYSADIPKIAFGSFMGSCNIVDESPFNFIKLLFDFNGRIYFKSNGKKITNRVSQWNTIKIFNRYIGDTYWLDIFNYYGDCVKFGDFHECT